MRGKWGLAFAKHGRRRMLGDWGIGHWALSGRTDAGTGGASPTQTGQRFGELIVKGGIAPIRYWM